MEAVKRLHRLVFFGLALAALACAWAARAQHVEATEASIKAAFLYKFASYVEWPDGAFSTPEAPFVFAVMGADDVAGDLSRLVAGRTVGSRPVSVRRMKEGESLRGVHLVFVGRPESARLASLARAGRQFGTLVVSEVPGGLEAGAAINFLVTEDRVGFEVSLAGAESGGHHISARMLQVARRVVQKGS